MGCSRKDLYPPWRKLAIPPCPSPDILYKFKAFFRQSLPPSPDGGNFLFGWGMDLFWNDRIASFYLTLTGLKDYIKGAYLIRKSWKQYKRNYEKILKIGGSFIHVNGNMEHEHSGLKQSSPKIVVNKSASSEILSTCDTKKKTANSLALQEVQAAIAFGYGLFNLVVSLTPPKVLQLAQFFGFHGNQELGLDCLTYVCHSQDVKSELSR